MDSDDMNSFCTICERDFFGATKQFLKDHKYNCKKELVYNRQLTHAALKFWQLAMFFFFPISESERSSTWNGKYLKFSKQSFIMDIKFGCHELSHWLLASQEERKLSDFGMAFAENATLQNKKDELLVKVLESHLFEYCYTA